VVTLLIQQRSFAMLTVNVRLFCTGYFLLLATEAWVSRSVQELHFRLNNFVCVPKSDRQLFRPISVLCHQVIQLIHANSDLSPSSNEFKNVLRCNSAPHYACTAFCLIINTISTFLPYLCVLFFALLNFH